MLHSLGYENWWDYSHFHATGGRPSVCTVKDYDEINNTELRNYWSPEEVIKSESVKSILVKKKKKVPHKVFLWKTNFWNVSKHSEAYTHSHTQTYNTFDVLTIKTHICSSTFITAEQQILVLLEHDVQFYRINLFWTQTSVTGLTGPKEHSDRAEILLEATIVAGNKYNIYSSQMSRKRE